MKILNIMNLLLLMSLIVITIACDDSKPDQKCSETFKSGSCEDDKVCNNGVCVDLCSNTNLTGYCQDKNTQCLNGTCVKKVSEPCSLEFQTGACEDDGYICFLGECKDEDALCSLENTTGLCSNLTKCIDGTCLPKTMLCSTDNPTGKCASGTSCLDGACRVPCSTTELNGYCENDGLCQDGSCIKKACKTKDIRPCYPGDDSEIGRGICQRGIKICNNAGEWGACKNAITPKEEICDNADNDCDGEIDEGVLNACGACGEVPVEIPNNHLDDDCDGKVDEDANNNGGMDSCDERTHQPCYTGPVGTGGKGICHGGFRDCTNEGVWGECVGQVLPRAQEICGDNIDNNCNGYTDEFCQSNDCVKTSETEVCGNHKDDECNGLIDDGCDDVVEREECIENEICDDGIDNDCDGTINNGCSCNDGDTKVCFSGDPSILNVSNVACKAGTMTCLGGEFWGDCEGEILPVQEICDGIDNDCDGIIDNNAIDGNVCGFCSDEIPVEICGDGIDNDCDTFIDEDCPDTCNESEEICDGIDNDCDGLTDEGVLNACGTCGESCYVVSVSGEDDFNNGEFDGVSNTDNPDEITLDSSTIENNFIWIANSEDDTVTKINTKTGEKFGPFGVGDNPSRTAVTRDGGVWVANRGSHNVTKLTPEGALAPGFPVNLASGCAPRGVALDKFGNAWVGCFALRGHMGTADGYVYKINSEGVIADGYPYESNIPIYGLAIDGNGYLWSSRLSDHYAGAINDKIFKIDTNKNPGDNGFFKAFDFPYQSYGLVVDNNNNVWYAGFGDDDIKRVSYNPNNDSIIINTFEPDANCLTPRGIAIDINNNIWIACSSSTYEHGTYGAVAKFNSGGEHIATFSSRGTSPIGIGVDSENNIWVVNRDSNNTVEFTDTGIHKHTYTVGHAPYSYSDITGFNLRNIVTSDGSFKTTIDTLRVDANYDSVKIDGTTPNGSKIKVKARVSSDLATWSSFSNTAEFVDSNTNIPLVWNGTKPMGRYIELTIILNIGNTENDKPIFRGISVNWQRP